MSSEQTQDERDLARGRVTREKNEAEAKLNRLKAKAQATGNLLARLSQVLLTTPHHTHFEAASTNVKMIPSNVEIFRQNEVDGKQIAQFTNELRDAIEELERVQKRARPYGI
jgi:hypothetical protein